MKRIAYAAGVATILGSSFVVAFPAAAATPGGPHVYNGHDCQGVDVSNYQVTNTSPPDTTFGSVVSGFAGKGGPLVGYVRGAANCGNN